MMTETKGGGGKVEVNAPTSTVDPLSPLQANACGRR